MMRPGTSRFERKRVRFFTFLDSFWNYILEVFAPSTALWAEKAPRDTLHFLYVLLFVAFPLDS